MTSTILLLQLSTKRAKRVIRLFNGSSINFSKIILYNHQSYAMAPALVETTTVAEHIISDKQAEEIRQKDSLQGEHSKEAFAQGEATTKYDVELNGDQKNPPAAYPHYLPYWDNSKLPPYEPFEPVEPGKNADPAFPNLLPAGSHVKELTANIGAEVSGIQLSKLNNAGKDELALFVAQHKVVAFRDQDFADLPIQEAIVRTTMIPSHEAV